MSAYSVRIAHELQNTIIGFCIVCDCIRQISSALKNRDSGHSSWENQFFTNSRCRRFGLMPFLVSNLIELNILYVVCPFLVMLDVVCRTVVIYVKLKKWANVCACSLSSVVDIYTYYFDNIFFVNNLFARILHSNVCGLQTVDLFFETSSCHLVLTNNLGGKSIIIEMLVTILQSNSTNTAPLTEGAEEKQVYTFLVKERQVEAWFTCRQLFSSQIRQ